MFTFSPIEAPNFHPLFGRRLLSELLKLVLKGFLFVEEEEVKSVFGLGADERSENPVAAE
jgi:hypothetical protein